MKKIFFFSGENYPSVGRDAIGSHALYSADVLFMVCGCENGLDIAIVIFFQLANFIIYQPHMAII